MSDRPTAAELVLAVRQYLEREIIPTLSDARLRFQTLVAVNVLTVIERELETEEEHLLQEWQWLAELLPLNGPAPQRLAALKRALGEGNEQLCQRIRQGAFDEHSLFMALSRQLRQVVERKLLVANPRYLASLRGDSSLPEKKT